MTLPPHHLPGGGFRNPWPDSNPAGSPLSLLKWQWQRLRHGVPRMPPAGSFPRTLPALRLPAAPVEELIITWLGQSSFLVQIAGVNVLLDPVLSERASPFARMGPPRLVPAALGVETLPHIHAVILSHDHYDHLDVRTLSGLVERFGATLPFFTPLGYAGLLARIGAQAVDERDWWQEALLAGTQLKLLLLPAQHWTRRAFDTGKRLWGSWLLRSPHFQLYFAGDSGYCPAFREIGDRVGAIDVALLPIGAYEPRWFMKPAHMNPEEAVQSYLDLGAREFVAMHWGTFRLTDEPPLEPPERTRREWSRRGLDASRLHIPQHGESLVWRAKTRSTT